MPRMQVYLPDELFSAVKERKLPASELLQKAVEAEIERSQKLAEMDAYIRELEEELDRKGIAPTAEDLVWAEEFERKLDEVIARQKRPRGKTA